MAYISADETKRIRETLKKMFPEFKLSVTTRHHSTVVVAVMAGPLALNPRQDVNEYYLEDSLKDQPELLAMFKKIMDVIQSQRPQKFHETGDYGNQPDYYIDLKVGTWNKPYQQITKG